MTDLIPSIYVFHSRKEILKAFQSNLLDLQMTNFNTIGTKMVALATIVGYILAGNELSPQKLFKLLAWLETVRCNLFIGMGIGLVFGSKSYYSCKRIEVTETTTTAVL